ncbi:unnamed protein product [Ixodes persulcatus]
MGLQPLPKSSQLYNIHGHFDTPPPSTPQVMDIPPAPAGCITCSTCIMSIVGAAPHFARSCAQHEPCAPTRY